MRRTAWINIALIDMDRYPLNPSTLDLVDWLQSYPGAWLDLPPIHVQRIANGRFRIKDGRHRITAYKLLGRPQILARFSDALGRQ